MEGGCALRHGVYVSCCVSFTYHKTLGQPDSSFVGPPSFHSVQFSRSVVSDSLRPHELQHPRPPCPSSHEGLPEERVFNCLPPNDLAVEDVEEKVSFAEDGVWAPRSDDLSL